jgi:hypothetical protein
MTPNPLLINNTILFEVIENVYAHAYILYSLLKKRRLNISHYKLPLYKEHVAFVENHPYRLWYLIKKSNDYVGSVYISHENTIGLALTENSDDVAIAALSFILSNHKPLPGVKSIRNHNFCVNIHPANIWLQEIVKNSFNGTHIQNTFELK